jgi:UDP-galactopyranose mutase
LTLVVGSHLRWDGVWQRPQHVLTRLSQHLPVVFVEEPFLADEERDEVRRDGAVTILRPLRRVRPQESLIDARAIATASRLAGEAKPIVWLYQPMMLELANAFSGSPLVYDCMDDLAAFAFAPPQMRDREAALLERAALVFCGGRTLYDHRRGSGEKVRLCPSGVEYERFAGAHGLAPHPAVAALVPPRFGYLGVIDERIDIGLIESLAAEASRSVVMVGPLAKLDPALLPRRPNVHFTGALPYATLPSILAGLEVALMPFAENDSTRSISPTKTLEYLAAGIPVVSTAIADVVADYGDVVTIADAKDFVRACARSAKTPNEDRIERGRQRARAHGWDAIVEGMWNELKRIAAPRSST